MKLSKALKQKNVLVKEINTLQHKISRFNSVIKGAEKPYDTKALYEELLKKTGELAALKTRITLTNQEVQNKIYLLSEYKSHVDFLRKLSTKQGAEIERYSSGEPLEYEAQISTVDVETLIKTTEQRIDDLQEELDTFNHITDLK